MHRRLMQQRKRWELIEMAEFKCISCGAVQESEESCICPVCGYKMLEMPYDKEEVLKQEIRDFIEKLRLTEVNGDYF